MSNLNQIIAEKYDFSQFKRVIEFINQPETIVFDILKLYPGISASCFGEQSLINTLKAAVPQQIIERLEFISGDYFSLIPENFPVCILNNIIGNLDSVKRSRLLQNLYRSNKQYCRLLLIEKINLENQSDQAYKKIIDGSENYLRKEFEEAGFLTTNSVHISDDIYLLEVLRL